MANNQQVPVEAAGDASVMDVFLHQWELYQKFLHHDYLSNGKAYVILHRFLTAEFDRPFRFLDLACGDASGIVGALQGTRITRYHGVDLAPPAIALARRNLEVLSCEVELELADFTAAIRDLPERVDVVWISLSLHHLATPEKRSVMRAIRTKLSGNGALLLYEPARHDDEDLPAYLDRFEATGRRDWSALQAHELREAMKHVRGCDLPETVSNWIALGREAGFSTGAELFQAPTDLFRVFCYRM